jgi:hypothetical protein
MSGFIKRNKYEYLDSFSLMYDLKFDQIRAYLENSQDMISRQKKLIKNIKSGIKNTNIILKCQMLLILSKKKS